MIEQNHKLLSILDHLREAIDRLEQKQELSLDVYLRSWDERDIVERELVKAVQSCIDCGARIISLHGWDRAEDYHAIFDVLCENDVLDPDLAQRIKELTGLRNVLAHEYRRIRNDEVYRHMQEAPPILRAYARAIAHAMTAG